MGINEILEEAVRQMDDLSLRVYKTESVYPSRAGALQASLYFALKMLTPAQLAAWVDMQNKSYARQLEDLV